MAAEVKAFGFYDCISKRERGIQTQCPQESGTPVGATGSLGLRHQYLISGLRCSDTLSLGYVACLHVKVPDKMSD